MIMEHTVQSKKMAKLREKALANVAISDDSFAPPHMETRESTIADGWGKRSPKTIIVKTEIEKEIEHDTAEAIRALSELNVQVGQVRDSLSQMKSDETSFLTKQEKKVALRITSLIDKNNALISKTLKSYANVKDVAKLAKSICNSVLDAQQQLSEVIERFEKKSKEYEEVLKARENDLQETEKNVKQEIEKIEESKREIERANKEIDNDKRRIADENTRLSRIIKRLENNRV